MIPLHKVPRGLLEVIRARSLGFNPDGLEQAVRATLNATPMYGSDLQVVATSSTAAGAVSQTLTGTAQFPGRLLAMSGELVFGASAGTVIRLYLAYSPGPSFQPVYVADRHIIPTVGATFPQRVTVLFPEPIVFAAGAQFIFTSQGDAGGADHVLTRRDLFENYAP